MLIATLMLCRFAAAGLFGDGADTDEPALLDAEVTIGAAADAAPLPESSLAKVGGLVILYDVL